MSYFVYVSHKNVVQALVTAEQLMENGCYPFVPQLNRLVENRSDSEWVNYYKMYLLKMDILFLTKSFRPHEKDLALENKIPIISNIKSISSIELSPYIGLGHEFGKEVAKFLPENENWRKKTKDELMKIFTNVCGIGADPLEVARMALMVWDKGKNEHKKSK